VIDGKLNYIGEVHEFSRLLNYATKQTGPIDSALNAKLKKTMKYDGTVSSFTVDETSALLKKFKIGLESSEKSGEKYTSRNFLYFIEDFEYALKNGGGYEVQPNYPLPSETERCNYNTHPDIIKLMNEHFGVYMDASSIVGGNVIEYAVNDNTKNAKFVIVIIDAHLKEQQRPIQRMIIDNLYPAGFNTIFSESDIYSENIELRVGNASIASYFGKQNEVILKNWPVPRSAHALEFYYGNKIKTYGAEDKILYRNFGQLSNTSSSIDAYIPALHERSYAMVNNIQKQMHTDGIKKSIMITGGAHVDSIMSRMDDIGMNYIVISPDGGIPLEILEDQRKLHKL